MKDCCLRGFQWEATPQGHETKLADLNAYITGTNPDRAIILIHDVFGWTFTNTRILADHYASEVDATVYVPDFFGGEVLPLEILLDKSRWSELDIPAFFERNTKEIRTPEILAFVRAVKSQYKKIGAIGFCFGGWAIMRLGAKGNDLVDCVSTAHPSDLDHEEIDRVGVPIQIMAPERDAKFTEELKAYCNRVIPTLGVAYDYQYFPGVEHSFATRGDPKDEEERKAMERAKNAAVLWFRQWLY